MSSFHLRSSTIRLGIFISTLIISIIIVIQLTWLQKVYRLEQKKFNHNVVKAVRGLYEDLAVSNYSNSYLNELIENPETHLYLAKFNLPVNKDTLISYLQSELEDFEIFTHCSIGVYDPAVNKFIITADISSAGGNEKTIAKNQLPIQKRNFSYLALFFPNRSQYILSQMNFWISSSIILLVVLIICGAGLFYFYRQKFITDIQKDFTYNFAHEFKTPVSVIGLAADVLSEQSILEKPVKLATYSGIVKYQADYLHNQIEKLLQFAYADSNRLHLDKEQINIHEIIKEAAENLTPLITDKNVQLDFGLNATTPVLKADKNYLLIVMTNLLENAIKYSKDPHISIATYSETNKIFFSITDNGVGINRDEIKKIFLKFYRSKKGEIYTTKGFGLGLTFVKMVIKAHRGKIRIDSIPGKGSTFNIILPMN